MNKPMAFPYEPTAEDGMTLRDYFAAATLSGSVGTTSAENVAYIAYKIADAMLAEREKKNG
jgi:hypothetical protein